MKVLLYGNGWIGSMLVNLLRTRGSEVIVGRARVDIEEDLYLEIGRTRPTHVICAIGRTHGDGVNSIDYLEQPGKLIENVRDNLFAPAILAHFCALNSIHCTYIGTGCIFDGDHNGSGFIETSWPNFFGSSYSVIKGFTDRIMNLYSGTVLNLRIRMPITDFEHPRNFITKIASFSKICSMPNSMTVLPELLPYAIDLMEKNQTGTVNFTNRGQISHNEILEMYKEIVDSSVTWSNYSTEEQSQHLHAARSNNFLNTTLLESMVPVSHIKDAVRKCLENYKRTAVLLVTGGCGFIGSNFINYIFSVHTNFKLVINLDDLYYCARQENILDSVTNSPRYRFIKGNLRNSVLLDKIFEEYQVTHVVHFAAQSHVQNSFENSLDFTYDNIVGTHVLLEACRRVGITKFVHISTDEVYGESMNEKKTEHAVLCPTNPYAATKAGAELIAQSYFHSYNLPIVISRGNNVFGSKQYPEKLIPKFIYYLQTGRKVPIQGNGSARRAFLHVDDTVRAIFCILEKGSIGEIYNIGSDGVEFSVLEIAQLLVKYIIGENANCKEWVEFVDDRPFNDKRYHISNDKLKAIGWSVQCDFHTRLEELAREQIHL